MQTFEKFIVEAEGFQGKLTPNHNAKKGAIAVKNLLGDNKPKKPQPPGKLALRPTTRAVQAPGALAVRNNRNTTTTKEVPRGVAKGTQAPTPSSASTSTSSGKPFRDVVRDAKAAKKSNSPAYGSELAKSNKNDLAAQQRNKILGKSKKGDVAVRRGLRKMKKRTWDATKNALKNNVKDVESVEGKEGKSAGRMQKQY
jgi:hypothetical protein